LNYHNLQCAELRQFVLKYKGIPFSNKISKNLLDLRESAEALKLPLANHDDADA
jgi:hypothetical protein